MSNIAVTVRDWGDEWTYTDDDDCLRSVAYKAQKSRNHGDLIGGEAYHRVTLNGVTNIERAPWFRAKRSLPVVVTSDDKMVEFKVDVLTNIEYSGETMYDIEPRETGVNQGK